MPSTARDGDVMDTIKTFVYEAHRITHKDGALYKFDDTDVVAMDKPILMNHSSSLASMTIMGHTSRLCKLQPFKDFIGQKEMVAAREAMLKFVNEIATTTKNNTIQISEEMQTAAKRPRRLPGSVGPA